MSIKLTFFCKSSVVEINLCVYAKTIIIIIIIFNLGKWQQTEFQRITIINNFIFLSSVYFRVFDSDGDGFLTRSDIEVMCKALIEIRKENIGEKVGEFN